MATARQPARVCKRVLDIGSRAELRNPDDFAVAIPQEQSRHLMRIITTTARLILACVAGCGPSAGNKPATPPARDTITRVASELQNLLVGRYQSTTDPQLAWSFSYPRYELNATARQAAQQGTFELYDRHPLLDRLGYAGTGAIVIETAAVADSPGYITVRPLWAGPGKLRGFQYLAISEVELPDEVRHTFLSEGSPNEGEAERFVPRNLPEFLPRVPDSNAERSEPAKTLPGELPEFLPRVHSNF